MTPSTRSSSIDTWRCIAVSLVIFGHWFFVRGLFTPIKGILGVAIFFFISGYVVSRSSLLEIARTQGFSSLGFYTRRAFRIIPPLAIYLGICLVLSHVDTIAYDSKQMLLGATYLCNVNLFQCNWYAGHTWTLAFEEQFYLLFPMIFAWVEISRRPSSALLLVFLAIASLPFFFPLPWVGKMGFVLIYGLFILGYLFAKKEQALTTFRYPNVVFLTSLVLTFLPVDLIGNDNVSEYYRIVYLVSIPLMISFTDRSFFRGMFDSKLFSYLGRISYSIYLWQQLFTEYFKTLPLGWNLLSLAAMLLLCAVLFRYVETPLIALGRRLSTPLPSRAFMGAPHHTAK